MSRVGWGPLLQLSGDNTFILIYLQRRECAWSCGETLVRVREHPLARTPVEVIYCSSPSTFVLYASVNFSTAMSATMELGAQRT